jgi:hypothetical protein
MATLLRPDGRIENVKPPNGSSWSLDELQTLVGGNIEVARTHEGHYLVFDEDGKAKGKPPNFAATQAFLYGEYDIILGEALVIDNDREMNGLDDD